MSVEIIAESLLRESSPTNSYLMIWVKEVAPLHRPTPSYSTLKFETVRWNTRKPLENEMDQAIYSLARSLIVFRQDGLDTPLFKAIKEYNAAVKRITAKIAKARAFKAMMARKYYGR